MTERTVFLKALEIEDRAARAAYLDEACTGQPELRQRIEDLLWSHERAEEFLQVPAMDQIAAADQSLAFLQPAAEPGSLGRLDHYAVLEVLGRGATGVVLKARDTKLQRFVAIKVLGPRLASRPAARARFVREAQAAAAVRDEYVVVIHAVNDDGPTPYLVMDYIDGITLEELIRQAGALEAADVVNLGTQLARGLAAAHDRGVVHRDVKPGNVLLEAGGRRARLADFGLAGVADDPGAGGTVLAGTPVFMSPEQARGEPTDFRGDLFSLGSVLYTMCAGRPPFLADTTAAVLQRVCEDTPQPVRLINPAVPEWLSGVIDRLLAKEPGQRFGSAREVADLLDSHLTQQQQQAPPAAPPMDEQPEAPPPSDSTPPRRSLLLAAACLGVLLAALAVFAALHKPWQNAAHNGTPSQGSGRAESLDLRRQNVPPDLLTLAGGGDPDQAPPELCAVLGNGKFLLPRVGQTAWMAQSPDGKILAVPLDEDVALFDARNGQSLRTLKGPGGRAFTVTFSRDNQLLAASARYETGGGSVRVWDLRADRALFTNPQPGMTISCAAAFSADGKRLFTEASGRLRVQDARSGQVVQDLDLFPEGIASIDVSPDGRRLAVTTWKKCGVMLLDWDGQKLTEAHTLAHPWPTASAIFSPDGNLLASADLTGLKLWDARSLEEVFAVGEEADQLAFTPDGRTLFATTTTETPRTTHIFHCWDVAARKQLSPLSVDVSVEPARAFHCLSRDGKTLFVVRQHGATYVKAIDTGDGKERFPSTGHVASLNVVAVSPDGRTVASAGEDWTVKLWDLADGRVLHTLAGHGAAVCGLDFSPDGKRLASGSLDGTIGIWDVAGGGEVRALHGHSRKFSRVRFRPDGRALAAGGEQGSVRLWDAVSGQDAGSLPGHVGAVRSVAYSPAGNLLASGGEDGTVLIHDLTGSPVRKLTAPAAVNDLAFSPDGRTLAAVGDGSAVCLWDVATGQEKAVHEQHTGAVFGVTFAPSAPLLATCGADGTVRPWDRGGADSALRTIGPGPFGGAVRSVAFTPDGRYLVTANANGLIYALRVGDDPRK